MQRNDKTNTNSASQAARLHRLIRFTLLALVALGLSACGAEDDLFGGATIESMTVVPDTIQLSDTGMTDEFFTVSLVVSGFTDEIDVDATEVFIQANGERIVAAPQSVSMTGQEIVLEDIAKTWVGGLEAGTYGVGATVQTLPPAGSTRPAEQVTQLDLATIEIVP